MVSSFTYGQLFYKYKFWLGAFGGKVYLCNLGTEATCGDFQHSIIQRVRIQCGGRLYPGTSNQKAH